MEVILQAADDYAVYTGGITRRAPRSTRRRSRQGAEVMTWPDAITLYAFGVLIGAPLLGRVLRGATIPPPEQDPRISALADATAERVHVLPA